jgi:hypothetical protein
MILIGCQEPNLWKRSHFACELTGVHCKWLVFIISDICRLSRRAPGASGVGADHFWQISACDSSGQPTTDSTAALTLPYSGFSAPVLCFYPGALGGAGWDCTGTQTYAASTITRPGITHFSDWAVALVHEPLT